MPPNNKMWLTLNRKPEDKASGRISDCSEILAVLYRGKSIFKRTTQVGYSAGTFIEEGL